MDLTVLRLVRLVVCDSCQKTNSRNNDLIKFTYSKDDKETKRMATSRTASSFAVLGRTRLKTRRISSSSSGSAAAALRRSGLNPASRSSEAAASTMTGSTSNSNTHNTNLEGLPPVASSTMDTHPPYVVFGILTFEKNSNNGNGGIFPKLFSAATAKSKRGEDATAINPTNSSSSSSSSYCVDWVKVPIPPDFLTFFENGSSRMSTKGGDKEIGGDDSSNDYTMKVITRLIDNAIKREEKNGSKSSSSSPSSTTVHTLLSNLMPSSSSSSSLSLPPSAFNNNPSPSPFVVFDSNFAPIFFSSRKSPYDSAYILHAANVRQQQLLLQQEEEEGGENNEHADAMDHSKTNNNPGHDSEQDDQLDRGDATPNSGGIYGEDIIERTVVSDVDIVKKMVSDGELPLVPVRRQNFHQLLIQQSVNFFFHRETVRFFACQPYRYSPRTFYRFPAAACSGYVALTIDDCPCRFDSTASSKLPQVLDLLKKHNSTATFMAIGQYISYPSHEKDLIRLLKEGHELANHGVRDEAMDVLASTSLPDFVHDVDQCNQRIEDLQEMALGKRPGVKWFRAPHGKYTKEMEKGIEKRGLYNVMCDSYAVDPVVEQSSWISHSLLRQTSDGSIILMHMPEAGFREYCLEALAELLDGLSKRGMKVVTVSKLQSIANGMTSSDEKKKSID